VHAVALVVVHLRDRRVDRDLVEVRPAEARDLRVHVRVDAAGEQRIVGEVDAGHDVRRAEGDLLGLGEEVVGIAVEHHAAHRRTGTSSSGTILVASSTSKLKPRPAPR
jgi:hypothetical protein